MDNETTEVPLQQKASFAKEESSDTSGQCLESHGDSNPELCDTSAVLY